MNLKNAESDQSQNSLCLSSLCSHRSEENIDGNVRLYHYHIIIQEASALNQHLCFLSWRISVVHRLSSAKDSNSNDPQNTNFLFSLSLNQTAPQVRLRLKNNPTNKSLQNSWVYWCLGDGFLGGVDDGGIEEIWDFFVCLFKSSSNIH